MGKIEQSGAGPIAPFVEVVHEALLSLYWRGTLLTGSHWRLYLNSGPGAGLEIGGRRRELEAGVFYVLPPNCNLKTWCKNQEIRQFYVHFRLDCLQWGLPDPIAEVRGYPFLLELKRRAEEAEPHSPRQQLATGALTAAVLALLPADALRSVSRDPCIENVCDMLRRCLRQPLSLDDLARCARLSPNQLIRRFRAETGTTPYQYLTNLRYAEAARLLERSELTLEEIIDQVGIRDRSQFSRSFREFYGMPPATYRNFFRRSV